MNESVQKAGSILLRIIHGELYIYLVHRHRYDDWSFPKGHIHEDESPEAAALRETEEETGMRAKVLSILPPHTYTLPSGQTSFVHMFLLEMEAIVGTHDVDEVDMGRWVRLDEVRSEVSYPSLVEYIDHIHDDILHAVKDRIHTGQPVA